MYQHEGDYKEGDKVCFTGEVDLVRQIDEEVKERLRDKTTKGRTNRLSDSSIIRREDDEEQRAT